MLFCSTLPQCEIIRIERIQNKLLWQIYIDCAKTTNKSNDGYLGEMTLFHGTSYNNPDQIYEGASSFDMRFSRDGMWGRGNYFATNASYSNSYSYKMPNGYRQMLVANVLTGYSWYSAPKSFTHPPFRQEKHKGIKCRYDSVNGFHPGGSKVYITYDNNRAYPAYLITYK